MRTFDRIFKTEAGQILATILVALGVAGLFRTICKDGVCREYRVSRDDLKGKVFRYNNVCYRLRGSTSETCSAKKIHAKIR